MTLPKKFLSSVNHLNIMHVWYDMCNIYVLSTFCKQQKKTCIIFVRDYYIIIVCGVVVVSGKYIKLINYIMHVTSEWKPEALFFFISTTHWNEKVGYFHHRHHPHIIVIGTYPDINFFFLQKKSSKKRKKALGETINHSWWLCIEDGTEELQSFLWQTIPQLEVLYTRYLILSSSHTCAQGNASSYN